MNFFKIIKPFDYVIVVILLAVAGFFAFKITAGKSDKYVIVKKNNIVQGEYPLNKDRIVEIENHILVEIKDNKVRVKQSPCKNQICVKQGWSDSQPIICAPQKLSVVIKSRKTEKEIMITH